MRCAHASSSSDACFEAMESILCDGRARFVATHLWVDAVFSMEHESVKQDPVQRFEHGFGGHPSLVVPHQERSMPTPRRHLYDGARAFPVDTCVRSPRTSVSPPVHHGWEHFTRAIPEAPFFCLSKAHSFVSTCCSRPFVQTSVGMDRPLFHARSSILTAWLCCQGVAVPGRMPRRAFMSISFPPARPCAVGSRNNTCSIFLAIPRDACDGIGRGTNGVDAFGCLGHGLQRSTTRKTDGIGRLGSVFQHDRKRPGSNPVSSRLGSDGKGDETEVRRPRAHHICATSRLLARVLQEAGIAGGPWHVPEERSKRPGGGRKRCGTSETPGVDETWTRKAWC